jgi:hypothetical protein
MAPGCTAASPCCLQTDGGIALPDQWARGARPRDEWLYERPYAQRGVRTTAAVLSTTG